VAELIIRFLAGGALVSGFALFGDLFKPKSFAGLFGAAPSVALATSLLTIAKDGRAMAAQETRSMLAGAIALCLYSLAVTHLLMRRRWRVPRAVIGSLAVWFAAALLLWAALLRWVWLLWNDAPGIGV